MTFSIAAGLLILIILGFIIYASLFLVSKTSSDQNGAGLEPNSPPTGLKFDTEGFEKLNLGK
jgi:hypothetical protein